MALQVFRLPQGSSSALEPGSPFAPPMRELLLKQPEVRTHVEVSEETLDEAPRRRILQEECEGTISTEPPIFIGGNRSREIQTIAVA